MATDDFTPIADANLPQPHLDVHTRPSRSQSFGSPKRTLAIVTADEGSANGDFYAHSLAAGEESDPNKSETPSAQIIRRSPYGYKRGRPNGAESESASEYRKDREEWNDAAIECLLEAYTEKFNQLNRGNLRGRDWKEVEGTVNERCGAGAGGERQNTRKSVEQCKNKIDNLKKRYKVELQKMASGGLTVCSWHWFKKIEAIVGNSPASKGGENEERNSGGSGSTTANRKGQRFLPSSAAVTNNLKAKSQPTLKWQRVVFKISGAALSGNCQNIDPKVAMQIAREVATACRVGVEVAIIVGGRNFFCGDTWVSATGLDRPTAYQIGMMATVMNSLLLQSALEKLGIQTRVQSTFSIPEVAEPYNRQRAIRHLEKGRVVIFGGIGAGSGNPLFSTDTAAALRASEINAEAVLKGTNVDGVYDCHSGNSNVTLNHMSFREVASRGVTSMDMMAITYCEENGIPVVVFNLLEPGHISRALCGDQVGTLIDQTGRVN